MIRGWASERCPLQQSRIHTRIRTAVYTAQIDTETFITGAHTPTHTAVVPWLISRFVLQCGLRDALKVGDVYQPIEPHAPKVTRMQKVYNYQRYATTQSREEETRQIQTEGQEEREGKAYELACRRRSINVVICQQDLRHHETGACRVTATCRTQMPAGHVTCVHMQDGNL